MPPLFPLDLPGREWRSFAASGFSAPACGVVYRRGDQVFCGMPLGNIDTGCLDLETSGLLGYCSLFNTFAPRRGPLNLPLLGVSAEGRTWVLAQDQPGEGVGEYQYQPGGTYRRWSGEAWNCYTGPGTTSSAARAAPGSSPTAPGARPTPANPTGPKAGPIISNP